MEQVSKINFKAFIWHGVFLALASNFMDVNTVIPAMLVQVGANSFHLGIFTAIMIGGASFMQLVFSLLLQQSAFKKKFILMGINIRILMLFAMSMLFYFSGSLSLNITLFLIYLFISLFSFSGSFSSVSYIDIIGKTIDNQKRKQFFSLKQVFNSLGVLISAFAAGFVLKVTNYPLNFTLLFVIASGLLLIASLGFWRLKEPNPSGVSTVSLKNFHKSFYHEWKTNAALRNYLLIINSVGVGVSLMPFLIILAKSQSTVSFDKIGDFLIFQTIGMLAGSLLLYFSRGRIRFRGMLLFDVILLVFIVLLAILLQSYPEYFRYIFVFSGFFVSSYKIITEAMLVEISNTANRTLYTGIAGAGNLFPMFIPIIAGYLLSFLSYQVVFGFFVILFLVGLFPVITLKCRN